LLLNVPTWMTPLRTLRWQGFIGSSPAAAASGLLPPPCSCIAALSTPAPIASFCWMPLLRSTAEVAAALPLPAAVAASGSPEPEVMLLAAVLLSAAAASPR
jgi:hypothetical protein